MLTNSSILVTGGTGSFGSKFVPLTLNRFNPCQIIIFSRDEMKQWEMSQRFGDDNRVKFVIGDVRDKDALKAAMLGVDFVVHAAATKIVPTAEFNPFECIKTNINGAMNVISAATEVGVKRVVALSTDKASNPINLYGATKLASDKLFVSANIPSNCNATKFSIVRYGNVMGSRGSVIPYFLSLGDSGRIPITDLNMTRFMITLEQGIDLVWRAFDEMVGGEIFVKKIPSMRIVDIASAIAPNSEIEVIGIRPGEKLHEQMIGVEDAIFTLKYDGFFKIIPAIFDRRLYLEHSDGVPVCKNFVYNSETNDEWMSRETLRDWIGVNLDRLR